MTQWKLSEIKRVSNTNATRMHNKIKEFIWKKKIKEYDNRKRKNTPNVWELFKMQERNLQPWKYRNQRHLANIHITVRRLRRVLRGHLKLASDGFTALQSIITSRSQKN